LCKLRRNPPLLNTLPGAKPGLPIGATVLNLLQLVAVSLANLACTATLFCLLGCLAFGQQALYWAGRCGLAAAALVLVALLTIVLGAD
jgi:hypothetical protein